MITLGDTITPRTLVTDQGEQALPDDGLTDGLSDGSTGGWTVLYFYPKDDTPGCTKESIGFSEKLDEFSALKARIIGVSKDSLKKHEKFRAKHGLTVFLASDENGTLCEDFGVWVEKSMYGKTYMGIGRATFLIDHTGLVRHEWRKVKVPGHADEVLNTLKSLTS